MNQKRAPTHSGAPTPKKNAFKTILKPSGSGASPLTGAVARFLAIAEQEDAEFAEQCEEDRRQLSAIRTAREDKAADWFESHAGEWDDLRRRHSPDEQVEAALGSALDHEPLGEMLDIGTGTGRMAELFGADAERVVALDKSLEMLRVARAKLQNLPAEPACPPPNSTYTMVRAAPSARATHALPRSPAPAASWARRRAVGAAPAARHLASPAAISVAARSV